MKRLASMRIFAVVTAIGAYCMVLMGAIVSKTGSGEGCGSSWPFCHGQLIPASLPIETVFEYSHRIVSGIDGALILILTALSWLTFKQDRYVKLFSFMSLFFVILQGGLGALTVVFSKTLSREWLLALHFGFSLISFASVVLLTIRLFQMKADQPRAQDPIIKDRPFLTGLRYPIWGMLIYTYIVVYSGALVRHSHATMGCGYEVPGCGTTIFPNFSTVAGIHMLHRYAAVGIWLLTLAFLVVVLRRYREQRSVVRASWLAFILITCQALSGMSTVLTGGVLMVALLHTTIISIYFSVVCYLCALIGAPWSRRAVSQEKTDVEAMPVATHSG